MKNVVRIVTITQIALLLLVCFISIDFSIEVKEVAASSTEWDVEIVDALETYSTWDASIAIDSNNCPHIGYCGAEDDLKYAKRTQNIWSIETVELSPGSPSFNSISIAIDSNDNPHISYWDWANADLKYAKWTGSAWSIETVDLIGWVGRDSSIALDSDDKPHISYSDSTNNNLKYAKWTGSTWSIQTVDSASDVVGWFTSIAIDSNDNPHISYQDNTNSALKYSKWTGSSWSIETVDSAGNVGKYTSIALDNNDYPHISYKDETNDAIKYAKWTGSIWNIETVCSIESGTSGSMALDSNGYPHISYYEEHLTLMLAKWTGSMWSFETVDSTSITPENDISIALDSIDNPHISYFGNGTEPQIHLLQYTTLRPDLEVKISDIVFVPSSPVRNGTSVSINATIHNVGDGNVDNVIVRFYDGYPTWNNQIGERSIPFIERYFGVGYAEINWVATPLGTHDIYVVIDPDNLIEEKNEMNNIADNVIEISIPDYIPRNSKPPPQYKVSVGKSVQISTQIKNVGIVNASLESTIAFYNQSESSSPFCVYAVQPLSANESSIWYNVTWTAPNTTGICHVIIEVDYGNVLEELSETNNAYVIEFDVCEIMPPTNLRTSVVDTNDIRLDWVSPSSPYLDHYLIYRAKRQIEFNFTLPIYNTSGDPDPLRTNWTDVGAAITNGEYYYVVRSANADESIITSTSNTAGKFTVQWRSGEQTFSIPLEPFEDKMISWYKSNIPNANYIKWMDADRHWQKYTTTGNPDINAEIGRGYVVSLPGDTKFTFTGMPGSHIIHKEGFGFDDATRASLTADVDANGNVTLQWATPTTTADIDFYRVLRAEVRDGFFNSPTFIDIVTTALTTYIDPYVVTGECEFYYMVVPYNAIEGNGSSTYSIGIWTEEYLSQYDTFGIPLKLVNHQTADWYCDNIPNTVGINYYITREQRWGWHSTRMPAGAYDPVLEMTEGYQISTSSATKYTFVGV